MNFDTTALKLKLEKAHKNNTQGLTNILVICLILALFTAAITGINSGFQLSKMLGGLLFSGVLLAICIVLFIIQHINKKNFLKRLDTFKDLISQGYVANECFTWSGKKQASVHFRKAEQADQDQGPDVAIEMPINESMIIMRSIRNSIVNNIPSKFGSLAPAPATAPAPLFYSSAPTIYAQEPASYPPAPSTYYPLPNGYYATPSTPQEVPEGYQHDPTDYQPSPDTIQSTLTTYHPVVTRYSRMPHLD